MESHTVGGRNLANRVHFQKELFVKPELEKQKLILVYDYIIL